jgi:dolichol-phosphate mannosyltransferase
MRDHSGRASLRVAVCAAAEPLFGLSASAQPSVTRQRDTAPPHVDTDAPAPPPTVHRLPAELSIIVPTRNECSNVERLISHLTAALGEICWEVIFVDDDSPDGTIVAVKKIAQCDPRIRGIRRLRRRGLAGAAIEGVLSSAAPIVAVMDGDLQHDPDVLPRMLAMLRAEEADLVVATRRASSPADTGFSPVRQRFSDFASSLAKRMLRVDLRDPMSGFFMIRREIVERVASSLSTQGFKILLDIVASTQGRLRVRECEYDFGSRYAGESKLDVLVALEYLGLLLSKLTNDALSIRFILFGLVGGSGIGVNIGMLWLLLKAGAGFWLAQLSATMIAMVSNYLLNNALTYRDRRRRGWRLLTGLASFVALCSVGVVANIGLATLIYNREKMWLTAGLAGALVGSVWNYAATSALTWG